MSIVERPPAADRADRPTTAAETWVALVPLWERSSLGWFVYGPDGRLAYANREVALLLARTPPEGTTAFIADLLPTARRAIEQRCADLRTGRAACSEALVPATVAGATCALLLTMVGLDGPQGRSIIGTVRRPLSDSSDRDSRVAQLESVLGHVMSELLAVAPEGDGAPGSAEPPLSPRQREVLELLLDGSNTSTIAAQLTVSQHTVRNHIKAIFRTLNVHSQTELIRRYRSDRPAPTD